VIVDAYAVVEPGAMMVEAFDTAVADGAVTGSWSSQDETVGAHLAWMYLGEEFEEVVAGA